MARYTMELRNYIEKFSQYEDGLSTAERIEIGRPHLFDFDYPIFDPAYKKVFETNFIRRFYMREIGFETEGLFKFQLETWLNIHMPYFNRLFESELIEFDPLLNVRMDSSHTKKNDTNQTTHNESSGTGKQTDDNFNRTIGADTPDGRLNLTTNDGEGVIEYASGITEENANNQVNSESQTTDDSTNDINSTEEFIHQRVGKVGVQTYSKMILEFRDTFLRIENTIHEEMQQLFMLVY